MLHILNGDATTRPFMAAGLPGTHIAWREALLMGPIPAESGWPVNRARYLAQTYELDEVECRADLEELERALDDSLAEEEVVLWFEDDLFCYVNLLYLIQWYQHRGS